MLCILLFPIALVTSITLTGILLYVGLASFAILSFINKRKFEVPDEVRPIIYAFLIYIFSFFITKLVNSGFDESSKVLSRTAQDLLLFLWVFFFLHKDDKRKQYIGKSLILAGSISVIYGLFQFFHLDFFHRQENLERISGFHKNAYSYAGQLIIFFFYFLYITKKTKNIFLKILIPGLTFFCILNTSERAVVLGVVIGLLVYLILINDKKGEITRSAIFTSIPFAISLFFHKYFLKRINNTISGGRGEKNARFKLWKVALALWKKNILFGVGKFPVYIHKPIGGAVQHLTHAHNIYLQMLVTNGLIGLLAYLNLLFSFLLIALRNLKNKTASVILISIIISFLVEGIFEFFWGDSEVRYLIIYFFGFLISVLVDSDKLVVE